MARARLNLIWDVGSEPRLFFFFFFILIFVIATFREFGRAIFPILSRFKKIC